MLSLPEAWVWDFWLADDGQRHHIFFLTAPKSLGDPNRRHRAARVGHAVSADLVDWSVLESPFTAGGPGSFDDTATWTGCVVRGGDGLWRMFYTGSRFLSPEPSTRHVETVGLAVSRDLLHWEKRPGPVVRADPRWYETSEDESWPDEAAWRDPWVFADPDGDGWHMLVTATANSGPPSERGVIGHAASRDLETWEVRPPLSAPGAGFGHLEVTQVACVDDRWYLLFSCDGRMLARDQRERFPHPGTWVLPITDPRGPFDVAAAVPVTSEEFYSGRLVGGRDGEWALMAFRNSLDGSPFPGFVTDPMPFLPDAAVPAGRAGAAGEASDTDVDRLSRATGRAAFADSVLAEASDSGCSTGGEQ